MRIRTFGVLALVTTLGCVSWPRGKVFTTSPQRTDYEEIGPVEATGFGWTKEQAMNRAALRLAEKAGDRGGNGVVAARIGAPDCHYSWSALLTALMFPPCWVDAEGAAVRFSKPQGAL